MKTLIFTLIILISCIVPVAQGQTSGCCTKSANASCNPVDRNSNCTGSPVVTFSSGANSGSGDCTIPAGAIITSCTVTLSNPLVSGGTANLDHVNATIISGTAGATLNMSAIGAAWATNWDGLGGVPVAGTTFSVLFTGTNTCLNNHSHTASVDVSVRLCWQLPSAIYTQSATGLDGTYLGNCMTNIACGASLPIVFADNGTQASGGLYSNNINNIYRSFCPNTTGKCVSAQVHYYQLENFFDILRINNGPTQNSAQLASLTGSKAWGTPVTYTSSDSSGCLSFRFTSSSSNPYGGFYITLNCQDCASAFNEAYTDCEGAISACGSTAFYGSSNGPGLRSSCSGCMISEHYTTWYKFEIATAGTLSMTIDAIDNSTDYDFAIFQSNDCNNLGTPVRCSYAAITSNGNTGMASGYTDASENVTGDGWLSPLPVTAPQVYYLMINNWSPNDAGFNLNFTLTGGSLKPCVPLPVEMTALNGICDQGLTELTWTTASETNNDYWAIMKSTDNTVFKTSGYVMGAGNSNELRRYYFRDPEENKGTVYYKLKQVDFDGTVTYSDLLAVNCNPEETANLQIRNFQDQGYLNLGFSSIPDEKYTITLIGTDGRMVYNRDYISPGGAATLDVPVGNLKAGIYRIILRSGSSMLGKNVFLY